MTGVQAGELGEAARGGPVAVGAMWLADVAAAPGSRCEVATVWLAEAGEVMSSSIELSRVSRSSTGCLPPLLSAVAPLLVPPARDAKLALGKAVDCNLCSSWKTVAFADSFDVTV